MFNVVVCEDNEKDLKKIIRIIDKYMINNKIEYNKHIFIDYNDSFMNFIEKKLPFKIYILDIETPSRSGIDIAREIRKKDSDSSIIFITAHNDLGMDLLKEDIPFTSFINKFVNCEDRLSKCLTKSLNMMHKKRVLKFKDRHTEYIINIDDILYITKESFDRKTIIVTDYNEFRVNNSLKFIKSILNNEFVQTHRACIVNKNRVCKIEYTNKEILFENMKSVDLHSPNFRKEAIK